MSPDQDLFMEPPIGKGKSDPASVLWRTELREIVVKISHPSAFAERDDFSIKAANLLLSPDLDQWILNDILCGLERAGNYRVVPVLESLYEHANSKTKDSIRCCLESIPYQEAIDALIRLFRRIDPKAPDRPMLISALANHNAIAATALLARDLDNNETSKQAHVALARMGTVESLIELSRSRHIEFRVLAMLSLIPRLSRRGDQAAVLEIFQILLGNKDLDDFLLAGVIRTGKTFGGVEFESFLKQLDPIQLRSRSTLEAMK